jgi:uncharacterized LabA/DUF88 family protein
MTRARLFKKADFTRAIRAAQDAGLEVAFAKVEKDGAIVVVPGKPPALEPDPVEEARQLVL